VKRGLGKRNVVVVGRKEKAEGEVEADEEEEEEVEGRKSKKYVGGRGVRE
jgi:hypothetical protein